MNTKGLAIRFEKMIRDKDNGYSLEIVEVLPWKVQYRYAGAEYVVLAIQGPDADHPRWMDAEVDSSTRRLVDQFGSLRVIGEAYGNCIYNHTLRSAGVDPDDYDVEPSLEDMLARLDQLT